MGILSVLLGIGIGVLSRLNVGRFTALGTVRAVLRGGREAAVATGLPVTVVCDGGARRVYDLSVRPLGAWAIESAKDPACVGAFGLEARLQGTAVVEMPGRMGAGIVCPKGGDHALVSVAGLASWTLSQGLALEADVLPLAADPSGVVLERSGQCRLAVRADGAGEGEVALAAGAEPGARSAGSAVATTPPGLVGAARWTRLALVYDRCALTVLVDGVPLAQKVATEPVRRTEAPLSISSRTAGFLGRIDDVKVGAVFPGEGFALPRDVGFEAAPRRIEVHFSPDGRLDPAFHRASVTVGMTFPEGAKRQVVVGPYGTVR
jgi:hypothetical protein